MELVNAFVNFLVSHRDLVTSERPVRLRLDHPSILMEDVLLPQRVDGHESLCGGFEYRVLCVALDARLPLKEFIALPAALDIVNDRGKLRTVCGFVTEALAGDSDGGLASYQIVISDMLAVMEKRTNTRVFRNLNEVEIVYRLRDEWQDNNPVFGPCFDVITDNLFNDMRYPKREFTMQYNETDAAFIRRLLRRRGISWFFEPNREKVYPAQRLRLVNRYDSVHENAAGTVRYHRDAPTEERDTITNWISLRTLQPMMATRHSWDHKTPRALNAMQVERMGQLDHGRINNSLSATLDDYQVWAPHAGDDYEDLKALGELAMDRHDFETKCFMGEGAVRDFRVGEYFALTGHPEIDRHQADDREFVITELHLSVQNNLPRDLADRVAKLFSRSGWVHDDLGKRPVKMRFTCVRRGVPLVPAYDPRLHLPPVHMQSALVVGPEKEEVYCDQLGRVKIRFPGMREKDHEHASGNGTTNTDRDSAWVRVASTWAGNGPGYDQCGALFLPRVGSEVLVAFLGGDPDKPVIVGQMYNQRATPPELSEGAGLPGNRHLSGIRSREVEGGERGNQLRLDDTKGEISAQLGSDHGHSQLNLGFFTTPKKEGNGDMRGEGTELRTDLQMALRAAQGILMTSCKSAADSTHQMFTPELQTFVRLCVEALKNIGHESQAHGGERMELEGLRKLMGIFDDWCNFRNKEARVGSAIGMAAVDGVGIVTGKTICTYSGENFDSVSARNIQLAAGEKVVISSKMGTSLYARDNGVKVIAQKGNLLLESQGGNADINSSRNLTIAAAEGDVSISGRKIMLVADDGSFLEIGNGIRFGTDGTIKHHASKHVFVNSETRMRQREIFSKMDEACDVRTIAIELVDADGNKPEGEIIDIRFPGKGNAQRLSATNEQEIEVPEGHFIMLQPNRIASENEDSNDE